MGQDRRNIVRQIAEGVALETARMRRKNGGGDYVAGYAARGDDGQGNAQRAFSYARYIVDRQNAHNLPTPYAENFNKSIIKHLLFFVNRIKIV